MESKNEVKVKELAFHQFWPGFKARRQRHMWVECVAGYLPRSERRFFSVYPLVLKRTKYSKF